MRFERFDTNPIITVEMDDRMGSDVNGPSLIRVPEWVKNPLAKYYLYFAHHQGTFIRMAYADELQGPWRIHTPGVLDLADSFFEGHVASPEVRVMEDRREIWMYYHGCCLPEPPHQFERLSISADGLHFEAREELLGPSYWRMFDWDGYVYGLAMPGTFYRSRDGMYPFEKGPTLFTRDMRHSAVRVVGSTLQVFYSNAHDCPERILMSTIDLAPEWTDWRASEPVTVLEPEFEYEGVDLPLEPSERGAVHVRARQLRDPAIFEDDGRAYLLYSVAGEHGIGIAQIHE